MRDISASRRIWALAVLVLLGYGGLIGWLGRIQLEEHPKWRDLAAGLAGRKTLHPARRGAIKDIRGSVLAISVPVKTVCADPSMMGTNQPLVARLVAPWLRMPETDLWRLVQPRLRTNAAGEVLTNAYVVLRHKVPLQDWQQATQAMARITAGVPDRLLKSRELQALNALRYKAIFGEDDHLRQYPGGALAAHVLGYAASSECENDQGRLYETHGLDGVELTLDEALSGVYGWSAPGEEVAPRSGLNVVLTLDAGVQNIMERALEAAWRQNTPGSLSAVVLRPRTGEVLALANYPAFDPNRFWQFPTSNLCNRAISTPAEPGSTFKLVVVSGALDARAVSLEDPIDCEHGQFVFAGRILHDHHPYGILSVKSVITKSSNIGAAKIGMQLGASQLYHYVSGFGFGAGTGILLPGESRGLVRPVARWDKLSISRIPMGHEVLTTPLQMVLAMAAIGNEGRLMRPLLVDRLEDAEGRLVRKFRPEAVRQAVRPETAREMITALKTVVSKDGTAPKAALEHYSVAGKTGTAEKFLNGTYDSGRYYSSFIGLFPADRPELCIGVMLDDPDPKQGHFGGEVAGPVFRSMAEQIANYLRLPPEAPPAVEPKSRPQPETKPELMARDAYAAHRPGGAPATATTPSPVTRVALHSQRLWP